MKKKRLVQLIPFLFLGVGLSAQSNIPDWYLEDLKREVGIWITDNSNYKNDQEPFEYYAIEWKWSFNKKSITGRLYGLTDGKETATFWEFRNYWDPDKDEAVLIQFGGDGTVGIGSITRKSASEMELVQVFTNPDGTQYRVGHKTTIIDSIKHIGSSFKINDKDEWVKDRTYKWVKEVD